MTDEQALPRSLGRQFVRHLQVVFADIRNSFRRSHLHEDFVAVVCFKDRTEILSSVQWPVAGE